MLRPRSLQQRLSLFMFLPVALLLIAMGFVGFIYARDSLVNQFVGWVGHSAIYRWVSFLNPTYDLPPALGLSAKPNKMVNGRR